MLYFIVFVLLVLLVIVLGFSICVMDDQRYLKEELAVHFRLLHSISRNVAELLPGEGDDENDASDAD
jgi:membrane-anchored glycerophosphoryl diester phosphodiesterase (GDPDase)